MGMYQGKLIIGIVGTHKGAGVTHFGILLAQYISECLGLTTAYLECYPQDEIQYLQYFLKTSIDEKQEDSFSIHRVTYYKHIQDKKIGEIIGDQYDCVILDLGTDFTKGKNEFLRCDKKIVVSSLSLWKRHELENFIQHTNHIKNSEQWIYAIPFGETNDIKFYTKEFQRDFYGIPYEPDPYIISAATIQLFQKLI